MTSWQLFKRLATVQTQAFSATAARIDKQPVHAQVAILFARLDADRDGKLSKQEVLAGAHMLGLSEQEASECFDRLDANNDNSISRAEFHVLDDSLFSVGGMRSFIANITSSTDRPMPTGRWSVSSDKMEKSYAYDHSL